MLAPPSISPDGRRLAIALRRNGRLRLHVLSADGAELQALTEAIDIQGATCWSPDGRWIIAGGDAADGSGLLRSLWTGARRRVSSHRGRSTLSGRRTTAPSRILGKQLVRTRLCWPLEPAPLSGWQGAGVR